MKSTTLNSPHDLPPPPTSPHDAAPARAGFVVAQVPPANTSWQPAYLTYFDSDGSQARGWDRDVALAHLFIERSAAETIAKGVRSNFITTGGWAVEVQPLPSC